MKGPEQTQDPAQPAADTRGKSAIMGQPWDTSNKSNALIRSLSWNEELGVQAGLTWLSSHGWSCSRWAQSVSGVTRAYLNRFWMAEVVQMYL